MQEEYTEQQLPQPIETAAALSAEPLTVKGLITGQQQLSETQRAYIQIGIEKGQQLLRILQNEISAAQTRRENDQRQAELKEAYALLEQQVAAFQYKTREEIEAVLQQVTDLQSPDDFVQAMSKMAGAIQGNALPAVGETSQAENIARFLAGDDNVIIEI